MLRKYHLTLLAAGFVMVQGIVSHEALADEALATQSGCLACHQIDKKLVGPSYQEVAAKYKGDEGAKAMLIAKVTNGGQGNWGPIPMPPKGGKMDLSDEDIAKLVDWVLTQ